MKHYQSILRGGPVVCAVDRYYQIMVPVRCDTLMRVTVNGKDYYNHVNGVRRSSCPVQVFTVPMTELNEAGAYTVHYQRVISRQAYACLKGREVSKLFSFWGIKADGPVNVYVISDCHGIRNESIASCTYFGGAPDLLILNGDVSSSCATEEESLLPLDIAWAVTQGSVPCIITRGNHDLRGTYSEKLNDYIPTCNGKTYYQVCLGPLWLLVLDCGEDKDDGHREYGGTAAYHAMRLEETAFLHAIADDPSAGFRDPNVRHKFVVSHIPMTYRDRGLEKGERPFDIEDEIYTEWISVLNERIRPDLCISGHLHRCEVWPVDSEKNERGVDCPVLIAGRPVHRGDRNCFGAAIALSDGQAEIRFTDKRHTVSDETVITN
jgi:hypothetical protein